MVTRVALRAGDHEGRESGGGECDRGRMEAQLGMSAPIGVDASIRAPMGMGIDAPIRMEAPVDMGVDAPMDM